MEYLVIGGRNVKRTRGRFDYPFLSVVMNCFDYKATLSMFIETFIVLSQTHE
jgi:hypothetical protein